MDYASAAGLIERFGANEIAQRASNDARVTGALFELTVGGGDRSAYTADEVAAADEALARVQQRVDDANAIVDSYLAALQLTRVPAVLVPISCDVARFLLYDDAAPETVTQRYQAALKFLGRVAKGELSLGMPPSSGGGADNTARIESAGKVFGRNDKGFI